jgi:hypothetical protein
MLDTLVLAIVYYILHVPSRWNLRTTAATFMSTALATLFALFVVVVTCASMVLMIETGMSVALC